MDPQRLKNTYYALRHGQSMANVQNLIVSHPDNGIGDFGLSETGREQVEKAFGQWPDARCLGPETRIFSSDFLRTRHTADIAAKALGCTAPVTFTPKLRERYFGSWELTGSENYERVWADDASQEIDPTTGAESVTQVLDRGLSLLKEIETTGDDETILLVSHGDTLQILMTWFAGLPPHRHRELAHLNTAEVRKLS